MIMFLKLMRHFLIMYSLVSVGQIAGCSSGGEEQETEEPAVNEPDPISNEQPIPPPTSLVCSQGTYLTYDNFGAAFLDSYCVSCHHSSLTEEERLGAPAEMNFESSELAQLWRASILAKAGGEGATMPPSQIVPDIERKNFAEWLNCGSPK
jgi:hypothetical protein